MFNTLFYTWPWNISFNFIKNLIILHYVLNFDNVSGAVISDTESTDLKIIFDLKSNG